jgi:hypothetical protein
VYACLWTYLALCSAVGLETALLRSVLSCEPSSDLGS